MISLHFNLLNYNVFMRAFRAFAPKARAFCLAHFVSTRREARTLSRTRWAAMSVIYPSECSFARLEENEERSEWISRASNGRAGKKVSHNGAMNVPSR